MGALFERPFRPLSLGAFRAFLALMVVVYHAGGGVTLGGLHIGVAAVVAFFVVSGFVMTGHIERFRGKNGIGLFYADRIMRLVPQYVFYCLVSLSLIYGAGITSPIFQYGHMTAAALTAHLTIIPLSAAGLLPTEVSGFLLIPQAWSLGTELSFYAVLPLIAFSTRRLYAGLTLSLAVLFAAAAGFLDPDAFGYRLLPGTLIFFALGIFLFRRERLPLAGIVLGLLVVAAVVAAAYGFDRGFNRSLYAGAVLGVAGVWLTSGEAETSLGKHLGAASYGCYLSHCSWIFVFQYFGTEALGPRASSQCAPYRCSAASLRSHWLSGRLLLSASRFEAAA